MKKITLVSVVAAAAFAATAAFTANNVFAADGDTPTTTTSSKTTTGHIGLWATSDGTSTGTPEAITIDSAPGFDFGDNKISTESETYTLKKFTDDGDTLQVTNPGLDQGWTVSASATPFTEETSKKELKGAVLTLKAGAVAISAGNVSDAATPTAITFKTAAQEVLSAASGTQGVGVNTEKFVAGDKDTASAELAVPAGNTQGNYSSTITWSLNNTPATK